MTRLEIYRLLRDRGPMTVGEITSAFPHRSRKAVLNRLSEMTEFQYPGMEITRVYRGVYRCGEAR